MAFAQENLSAILDNAEQRTEELKQKQLDVDQATLNREQARIRNQRAQQDAQRTRGEGVEGSDEVVAARERVENAERAVLDARRQVVLQTRALRDASRNVVVALREVKDAHTDAANAAKNQSSSQQNLNEALKELTPAERGLVRAIDRFKRVAQREFGPIQDIITGAFTRAIQRAEQILLDPRVQRAARRLATSIASVIDAFSKFAVSDEFKDALVFFTNQAARNVPKLGTALLDIIRILVRLGRVGTPVFNNLLDRFVKFIDRIERATRNRENLENYFGTARRHLNAWIGLATAIGNLVGAFISIRGPAETGRGLLEDITEVLNGWAEWLRQHPEEVTAFFDDMAEKLRVLSGIFLGFGKILFEVFTSDEADAFAELILTVVLPAVGEFIKLLGLLSKALVFLFDIPVVGDLLKWGVQLSIIYGLFNRLFTITGILGREGFSKLFKSLQDNNSMIRRLAANLRHPIESFKELREVIRGKIQTLKIYAGVIEGQLRRALKAGADQASLFATYVKDGAAKLRDKAVAAGRAAVAVGTRFKEALINAGREVLLFAQRVGVAALGALRRFAAFLAGQMVLALRLLRTNIRLLVASTGIGALIVAGLLLIENWDKVKAAARAVADFVIRHFKRIVDWVRENWKLIVGIIIGIFTFPVGPIAFAIFRFRDRIIGVFKGIGTAIINAFKNAFSWVRRELGELAGWIERKIKSIPLLGRLLGDDPEKKIRDDVNDRANKVLETRSFNRARPQIKRLRAQGKTGQEILELMVARGVVTEDEIAAIVDKLGFQHGVEVPGGEGKAVPAIVHAGEWVLNKMQQSKLVDRLNMSRSQIQAWLFGTNMGAQRPGPSTTKTKPTTKAKGLKTELFDLRPQEDDYGVVVWFLEMADGTFARVTARDAAKIKRTQGNWVPGYIKRNRHGYNRAGWATAQNIRGMAQGGVVPSYAMGGVVGPVQSFAEGGVVLNGPSGPSAQPIEKNITQNFEVKAEGEQDWNYIMRLGAIHAMGSY